MGMQVNLVTFLDPATAVLSAGFLVAAILGKLFAGIAAFTRHLFGILRSDEHHDCKGKRENI